METDRCKDSGSWGVALLSTGCPGSREEVGDFISGILADHDVMSLPAGRLFSSFVPALAAILREEKIAGRYEAAGGYSRLTEGVEKIAGYMRKTLGIDVKPAYRYASPDFYSVLNSFRERGIGRIVAIPLNPQFSISTTGSFISHLAHLTHLLGQSATVFSSFYREEGYIGLVAEGISRFVSEEAGAQAPGRVHFLFVAHSVPISNLKRRDPYISQVEEMVSILAGRLDAVGRHSLAYQSAVGPAQWVGPEAGAHVRKLARDGVRSICVVPLSFVVENIETLYDLDIKLKETACVSGIENYFRVPAPGADEGFGEFLCGLVRGVI